MVDTRALRALVSNDMPVRVRLAALLQSRTFRNVTAVARPWQLIYYETFYCKTCTDKREHFLKSGIGFKLRKIILENYDKLK